MPSRRCVDLHVFVNDGKPRLVLENDPVLCELITQARVVGALEASSAESGVDLHCRGQNARGDLIVQHMQEDLRVHLSSVVESLSEDSRLQPPVR
jgi:hypothetical protein